MLKNTTSHSEKAKDTDVEPMSFAFIEGCMFFVGNFRRKAAECRAESAPDGRCLSRFLQQQP